MLSDIREMQTKAIIKSGSGPENFLMSDILHTKSVHYGTTLESENVVVHFLDLSHKISEIFPQALSVYHMSSLGINPRTSFLSTGVSSRHFPAVFMNSDYLLALQDSSVCFSRKTFGG